MTDDGLIVEDGRADENPVEPAVSDDRLLTISAGEHLAQKQREDQLLEQKPAVPDTVDGANSCNANQARDLRGLPGAHERLRRGGGERHLAEGTGGCAECADDRVPTFQRLTKSALVAGVADDELCPF